MPRETMTLIAAIALTAAARGDGGALRLTEKRDGIAISVFTSPTPPCAGPIDVSVLIQSEKTGDAIRDEDVIVTARLDNISIVKRATAQGATNKLMQAAQ